MADIYVKGLRELNRKLRSLPNDVARKHLQKAVNEGANHPLRAARSNAPVGQDAQHGNPKGFLKSQIRRRAANRGLGKYARAAGVGVITNKDLAKVRKASGNKEGLKGDAYYWVFVEFGTSKHPQANPFIRSASLLTQTDQFETVRKILRDGLFKEARR